MQKLDGNTEFYKETFNDVDNQIVRYKNKHNLHLNKTSVDQQRGIL
jgi:hypothetical protein